MKRYVIIYDSEDIVGYVNNKEEIKKIIIEDSIAEDVGNLNSVKDYLVYQICYQPKKYEFDLETVVWNQIKESK